jgi:hypothetical protein
MTSITSSPPSRQIGISAISTEVPFDGCSTSHRRLCCTAQSIVPGGVGTGAHDVGTGVARRCVACVNVGGVMLNKFGRRGVAVVAVLSWSVGGGDGVDARRRIGVVDSQSRLLGDVWRRRFALTRSSNQRTHACRSVRVELDRVMRGWESFLRGGCFARLCCWGDEAGLAGVGGSFRSAGRGEAAGDGDCG